MSPPLLGGGGSEEEVRSSLVASSAAPAVDCNGVGLKERNYLGLSSDCSSVDSSGVSGLSDENKGNLNFKATELRLGLPGSHSPERDPELSLLGQGKFDEKQLFPLLPSKDGKFVVLGNKRGFSDTMDEGKWRYAAESESESPQSVPGQGKINVMLPSRASAAAQPAAVKEAPGKALQERCRPTNTTAAPAAKEQVVGWPPIRSFRKNSLNTASKNNEEVDGKPSLAALFVKVSMDGAPYLRKVDLRTYATYQDLSSALEKMFSCFTIGQWGSHGAPGKEKLSESKLRDLLHGSEYVLTYEDRDGDWMLVGDVPWEMFIDTCKKLKIMKGSDAIGLAPRAAEKSQNRN